MTGPVFFASGAEFHRWLDAHHDRERELLVGFHKKGSGKKAGITYQEALDAALCHGWIDGVRKRLDAASYTIRFTPRKPGSIWSLVNTKRATALARRGLMAPPGLRAFRARDPKKSRKYSYEARGVGFDRALEARFRLNGDAWAFFQSQPKGYRRLVSYWVMSAKKDETRARRLAIAIERSAGGTRIDFMKPRG